MNISIYFQELALHLMNTGIIFVNSDYANTYFISQLNIPHCKLMSSIAKCVRFNYYVE